jgi:hypothetical protein
MSHSLETFEFLRQIYIYIYIYIYPWQALEIRRLLKVHKRIRRQGVKGRRCERLLPLSSLPLRYTGHKLFLLSAKQSARRAASGAYE